MGDFGLEATGLEPSAFGQTTAWVLGQDVRVETLLRKAGRRGLVVRHLTLDQLAEELKQRGPDVVMVCGEMVSVEAQWNALISQLAPLSRPLWIVACRQGWPVTLPDPPAQVVSLDPAQSYMRWERGLLGIVQGRLPGAGRTPLPASRSAALSPSASGTDGLRRGSASDSQSSTPSSREASGRQLTARGGQRDLSGLSASPAEAGPMDGFETGSDRVPSEGRSAVPPQSVAPQYERTLTGTAPAASIASLRAFVDEATEAGRRLDRNSRPKKAMQRVGLRSVPAVEVTRTLLPAPLPLRVEPGRVLKSEPESERAASVGAEEPNAEPSPLVSEAGPEPASEAPPEPGSQADSEAPLDPVNGVDSEPSSPALPGRIRRDRSEPAGGTATVDFEMGSQRVAEWTENPETAAFVSVGTGGVRGDFCASSPPPTGARESAEDSGPHPEEDVSGVVEATESWAFAPSDRVESRRSYDSEWESDGVSGASTWSTSEPTVAAYGISSGPAAGPASSTAPPPAPPPPPSVHLVAASDSRGGAAARRPAVVSLSLRMWALSAFALVVSAGTTWLWPGEPVPVPVGLETVVLSGRLLSPAPESEPEPELIALELADAAVDHGHGLRRAGRGKEAVVEYRRALAAIPNYPRALTGMVRAYLVLQDGEKASYWAARLTKRQANVARNHRLQGDALRLAGKEQQAVAAYRRAVRRGDRVAARRLRPRKNARKKAP